MTLDKAIEILQDNINAKPPGMNHDYFDAVKLGIEALKRIKGYSNHTTSITLQLLPGETAPVNSAVSPTLFSDHPPIARIK